MRCELESPICTSEKEKVEIKVGKPSCGEQTNVGDQLPHRELVLLNHVDALEDTEGSGDGQQEGRKVLRLDQSLQHLVVAIAAGRCG